MQIPILTAALRPSFRKVSVILKSMDHLALRFRSTVPGKAFADNWKTARVVRDLGSNNPTGVVYVSPGVAQTTPG